MKFGTKGLRRDRRDFFVHRAEHIAMNTTNSGQLSYKEACTVGSATAAAVARAPVGATKEVLDKLDKANAAAEAEANLQVDRAAKKAKRKAKKLEKQAAIEKGKRKEAKQKRRTEKTRVVEEEQARAESARKVRREAKRATREEKREEKRASADSAVVADLLSLSSHDFPQASLLLSTDNVVAADHGEVGGTASAPDMDDDALDDELVKSLDATEAEVMRRSATAAGGDEFAQCHATAAEADANSVAEADSEVESEAKAVEAGFASFGCRTCGYSGGTQCDCAFYEDYSEDGNGEGGGACGDGEGAGDACDGNAASSGSGTSGGLQVGGYGCGWQPGAHCDLSDLDSEAEIEEAERCVDVEAERAWRLAHEAQPKGGGSVEQSVVKLEDINGTVAAKKRSVNVGIYETGQRETKFLRRSDDRGSNARRALAITGELMPALSIAPVAAAAATPAATPHDDAAHDLLDLMFAAPGAGGGIGGGGNVGGGDGGGGGGDGDGADERIYIHKSNDGDGMPTLDEQLSGDGMEQENALEVDGDFGGGGHGAAAGGDPLQQLPIERPFGVASEAEARAAQEQADPGLLVAAQEQAVAEALRERQAAAQQQVLEEERLARRAQVAAQVAAAQAARGDAGEEPLVIVAHGTRVWTEKQRLALALFGEGRSLALLGFAGTGKTVRRSSLQS